MKLHFALKRIPKLALVAMLIAQCAPSTFSKNRVAPQPRTRPSRLVFLNAHPLFGDFDGDRRLDRAELHLAGAHRCIRVSLGDSRESHLEFGGAAQLNGALLTGDVNRDNKPDLIWVPHLDSEPAVVWLSDGLGHFAKAADDSIRARLREILDDSDHRLVGDARGEVSCLTPDPVSTELARSANVDNEIPNALPISWRDDRRELRLPLSYLRERGPPLHVALA